MNVHFASSLHHSCKKQLLHLLQGSEHKRSRQDKQANPASKAASNDGEEEALPNLDADITPEEMQMMQAMGIPFVSSCLSITVAARSLSLRCRRDAAGVWTSAYCKPNVQLLLCRASTQHKEGMWRMTP